MRRASSWFAITRERLIQLQIGFRLKLDAPLECSVRIDENNQVQIPDIPVTNLSEVRSSSRLDHIASSVKCEMRFPVIDCIFLQVVVLPFSIAVYVTNKVLRRLVHVYRIILFTYATTSLLQDISWTLRYQGKVNSDLQT